MWSYLPILHSDLVGKEGVEVEVKAAAWGIVAKRGLCGILTKKGGLKVPSVQDHAKHLPELWTAIEERSLEKRVQRVMQAACQDIVTFISQHWDMDRYEAAFFANPPSLQSVPSLAHFHVLVRPITTTS